MENIIETKKLNLDTLGDIIEKKLGLEIGPDLGELGYKEAILEIDRINATLGPSEKLWRLPTVEEFNVMGEPIQKILDDETITDQWERMDRVVKYYSKCKFGRGVYYWSGDLDKEGDNCAMVWSTYTGDISSKRITNQFSVLCVR